MRQCFPAKDLTVQPASACIQCHYILAWAQRQAWLSHTANTCVTDRMYDYTLHLYGLLGCQVNYEVSMKTRVNFYHKQYTVSPRLLL